MIGLMLVYVDVLFTCGECGFNSLGGWFYSKESGWHSRNLILAIDCYSITKLIACLWPNG